MAKDEFRWVSKTTGDKLVRKLNEEVGAMEEKGYQLEDKRILEEAEDGSDNMVTILLHFSKDRFSGEDNEAFIEAVDLSVVDKDYDEGNVDGFNIKEVTLSEQAAEKINNIKGTYPDHEVVDMEVDEEGRTLFLRFEPL